jgi:hypothetical protein
VLTAALLSSDLGVGFANTPCGRFAAASGVTATATVAAALGYRRGRRHRCCPPSPLLLLLVAAAPPAGCWRLLLWRRQPLSPLDDAFAAISRAPRWHRSTAATLVVLRDTQLTVPPPFQALPKLCALPLFRWQTRTAVESGAAWWLFFNIWSVLG